MKKRGFWEIIIVIILFLLVIDIDFGYDTEKNKKYIGMSDNDNIKDIALNDVTLSYDNNLNETIREYVNDTSSIMSLGVADIDITCRGTGATKDKDEALANKNIVLDVYFSWTLDGERVDSLLLNKNEKVYIHINNRYIGEEYPMNDVECQYNIRT